MKLTGYCVCVISTLFIYLIAGGSFEAEASAFLDPRLEAWSSMSDKNSIASSRREMIVFFKAPAFQNRSGMSLTGAIAAEESMMKSYLSTEAARLLGSSGTNNRLMGGSSVDVLWASQAIVTSLDRAQLRRVSNDANVEAVIENAIVTLDEPIGSQGRGTIKTNETKMTYGLQKINVQAAWEKGITGEGVTVGVIDTGVDQDHPDLAGKIILQKDFTSDNDNKDYHGHGTHVSGTILGGKASGTQIGVAPGAKIIMAKVFNSKGQAATAELLKAMEWFLDPDGNPETQDSPRIVSNSWGSNSQFVYGFRNIVRQWKRFGIFPNFAAGNSGYFFTVGAPGAYPFSFAVGAIDENLKVTSFSSRGPVIDWENRTIPRLVTKPEVSAPGFEVLSSVPAGKWERYSGTSMATPHIAGVIALILQTNPKASIEEIETILNSTALDRGSKGKDNRYGNGVVQVDQVIAKALALWGKNNQKLDSSFQDKDPSQWAWATP